MPASTTRDDFYWTLHAVFVKRHEHSILYDQAFQIFFRKRAYFDQLMAMMLPQVVQQPDNAPPPPAAKRVLDAMFKNEKKQQPQDKKDVEIDARLTVSDREVLEKKDFAQMSAAEIAEAKQAIKQLVLPLDEVKTRRLKVSRAWSYDRSAPHVARPA